MKRLIEYFVLICILGLLVGCGPDPAKTLSKPEVASYVEWSNERQVAFDDYMAKVKGLEGQAQMDQVATGKQMMESFAAREPLKGTPKGQVLRELGACFFTSGNYFRDEKQLGVLREKYGKDLVDSGAQYEDVWKGIKPAASRGRKSR